MKFTIYIMRHGETYLNKHQRVQGWSDSPLTMEAISQIEKNRDFFISLKPKFIVTSDLKRTIETANLIIQEEDIEIKSIPSFREAFYGGLESSDDIEVWENILKTSGYSSMEEIREKSELTEIADLFHLVDPEKRAERGFEIIDRIIESFDSLKSMVDSNDKILIVSHGAFMRLFIYYLSGDNIGIINNLDCIKCDVDTSLSKPIFNVEIIKQFDENN